MPRPLLRPRDQSTLAAIALTAAAAMAVAWVWHGGGTDRLIEIDRAEPLEYQFLVDVNQAEWPEIAQLPEVGEVLAQRIVDARKNQGPFTTTEQLMDVPGIGPRRLSRIEPFLVPLPGDATIVGN